MRAALQFLFLPVLAIATVAQAGFTAAPGAGMLPPMAPEAVDTAAADLYWPEGAPGPRTLLVAPDSLRLGDVLQVAVDVPDTMASWPDSLLVPDQDWLGVAGTDQHGILIQEPGDPPPAGALWPEVPSGSRRLVRALRVWGLDPFMVRVPGWASPVITVTPRLAAADSLVPVRDPRPLGWRPAGWLAWALGGLFLLGVLVWRLRALRRPRRVPPDTEPPGYPWLEVICDLQELWDEGLPERGRTREFLDRLAALARRYAAGRYLVEACGMTGPELQAVCVARGHDPGPVRELAAVITAADSARYHPVPPSAAAARRAAGRLLAVMNRVRILPRHRAVDPKLSLRAEAAWRRMTGELGAAVDLPDTGEGEAS